MRSQIATKIAKIHEKSIIEPHSNLFMAENA